MTKASDAPRRTRAPAGATPVVLYDGHCDFCTDQATKLHRLAKGRFRLQSFHDEGALDDYSGLTHEHCMKEIKMVGADGRVFGGAEAIVRALDCGHPLAGKLLFFYYIPGIRQLAELMYAAVAERRYALPGRARHDCETGSCRRHGHPPDQDPDSS